MILVTGGAGFIGSNFVLEWCRQTASRESEPVLVVDCLTYAGNLENLESVSKQGRFDGQVLFSRTDIRDSQALEVLAQHHRPRAIVHFAAESHVDRSIHGPRVFIETNVLGTLNLLQWGRLLQGEIGDRFRFLHISTDEVYGSLANDDPGFSESTAYAPNSPYSASKAASDHLVRAWHHSFGLNTLTTNCSNNYGPLQFPEKLIPLLITRAIEGKALPIYGDGLNVRDWLYVEDHCRAIIRVLERGMVGEVYNIGGNSERTNLEVVEAVCAILDKLRPKASGSYRDQIEFVRDRPGHDKRYAINASKIYSELGWMPEEDFDSGLLKTVNWYLGNMNWVSRIQTGAYRDWLVKNYGTDEGAKFNLAARSN
jgi:dTDP-glucose 4,6-dehydratase